MTTETQTRVNDINSVARLFLSNMGSPKTAAKHFKTILHSIVTSRDTDILTKEGGILDSLIKAGDRMGVSSVRVICEAVYPGAKFVQDKKTKRWAFKIAGIKNHDAEALKRFDKAVEEGKTLRSTLASATRGKSADKPAFDPKAWAERAVKGHKANEIDAMIAALQAQRKAM